MDKTAPLISKVIQSQIRKLSETAERLNVLRDELTRSVLQIDDALAKIKAGVSAWVDKDGVALGYDRHREARRWGLCIREGYGSGQACWPFDQAPFTLRVKVFSWIPELLLALEQVAKDELEQANRAKGVAADLLTAIRAVAIADDPAVETSARIAANWPGKS